MLVLTHLAYLSYNVECKPILLTSVIIWSVRNSEEAHLATNLMLFVVPLSFQPSVLNDMQA